jgi:hypothetical protein
VGQHRVQRPGLGVARVDRQRGGQGLAGGRVVLGVELLLGPQHQRRHQPRVQRQGRVQRAHQLLALAAEEGPGQAQLQLGVRAEPLETLAVPARRQRVVVLVEGELPGGQVDVAEGRVLLRRLVEVGLQHRARLVAQQQRGLARRDQLVGAREAGPGRIEQPADPPQDLPGPPVTHRRAHPVQGQQRAQAVRVARLQGLGRRLGLVVASGGLEGLDQQQVPVFGPGPTGQRLLCGLDALVVVAGLALLADRLQLGGSGHPPARAEEGGDQGDAYHPGPGPAARGDAVGCLLHDLAR